MNYRNIIEESKIGQITQGSIFNGAKSSAYPNNGSADLVGWYVHANQE